MHRKTVHSEHNSSINYLTFGLLLISGIVTQRIDLITIITIGLVLYSLLDMIPIQDKPQPAPQIVNDTEDDDNHIRIKDGYLAIPYGQLGDPSLITRLGSYDWPVKRKNRDEIVR